jgi:hypothetical protein
MFRFILTILLMAACFFAGKMLAQEELIEFSYEVPEQADVSLQEILALTQNVDLQSQFPDLYNQLMGLLATPQIQLELVNPDRLNSPVYQSLLDLVMLINLQLTQEII